MLAPMAPPTSGNPETISRKRLRFHICYLLLVSGENSPPSAGRQQKVDKRHASAALALLAVAAVSAQPAQSVLRVKVTLASDTQVSTPIQRHLLLVSDNPPSAEPRRIFTTADGTVVLTLRPGSYIVHLRGFW